MLCPNFFINSSQFGTSNCEFHIYMKFTTSSFLVNWNFVITLFVNLGILWPDLGISENGERTHSRRCQGSCQLENVLIDKFDICIVLSVIAYDKMANFVYINYKMFLKSGNNHPVAKYGYLHKFTSRARLFA